MPANGPTKQNKMFDLQIAVDLMKSGQLTTRNKFHKKSSSFVHSVVILQQFDYLSMSNVFCIMKWSSKLILGHCIDVCVAVDQQLHQFHFLCQTQSVIAADEQRKN